MSRRRWLKMSLGWPLVMRGAETTLRGRVRLEQGGRPVMVGADGAATGLLGDRETMAVLRDERLRGDEFEVRGRNEAGGFEIDPIHTRALFLRRGGKRLVVTYWCDICSIRAWTPGKCQCCQEEMALDPRDPALKDTDPSH